jgi:hypothetical protein
MSCGALSLLVHLTVEPAEILIGFGVNPPLTIAALIVVGVGEVLLEPHAIAAINDTTTKVILIVIDMITSYAMRQVQAHCPIADGHAE